MRRLVLASLGAALTLQAAAGLAQTSVTDDAGNPLPARSDTAKAGALAVTQLSTTDPDRFVREWNVPTPGVTLTTEYEAEVDQQIVIFLIFTGCKTGADGTCNVRVDWEVFSPDGKKYAQLNDAMVWDTPPLRQGVFMLGDGAMATRIRADEPLGTYRARATVRDVNAGVSTVTESEFTVKPAADKPAN